MNTTLVLQVSIGLLINVAIWVLYQQMAQRDRVLDLGEAPMPVPVPATAAKSIARPPARIRPHSTGFTHQMRKASLVREDAEVSQENTNFIKRQAVLECKVRRR